MGIGMMVEVTSIHYCEVKAAIAFKSEYNTLKSHYPECSYYAQIDAIIAG